MKFEIGYDGPESLLERLLKVRKIDCEPEKFIAAKLGEYRNDPRLLNDLEIAVERILQAMDAGERTMIFSDYDVDGVMSSYILLSFFQKFVGYKNISVQYPDRFKDGYGLKTRHLDQISEKSCDLVITVDNGITSVEEAKHAKKLGLDLIITDHHAVSELGVPEAMAVVNPQVSPKMDFKSLCGAAVAFKVVVALAQKLEFSEAKKREMWNRMLPIVAIATVADCVPLVGENRALLKEWLRIINEKPKLMPPSLRSFLKFLKVRHPLDSFHFGFVLGPRINAGGRVGTPLDSLRVFLAEGEKQLVHLEKLEALNTERKKLQDSAVKMAEKMVDPMKSFLVVVSEDFHEGVLGIVAGRIAEKFQKPTLVAAQDGDKIVGSLRGPKYFHIVEMLDSVGDLLERYGGHKQAGGVTLRVENREKFQERCENFCGEKIEDHHLEPVQAVDTILLPTERSHEVLQSMNALAPRGVGNLEPIFLLENLEIVGIERVGKNGGAHLKLRVERAGQKLSILFWGRKDAPLPAKWRARVIGKVKPDDFNGGFFVEGVAIEGV